MISNAVFERGARADIYSAHLLRVFKLFKGEAGAQLTVITEGGRLGNEALVVSDALELNEGEMGIFFLEPSRSDVPNSLTAAVSFAAYGSVQGFIRYDLNDHTAADAFTRYQGIENDLYGQLTRRAVNGYREVQANDELNASRDTVGPLATPIIGSFSPNPVTAGTDAVLTSDQAAGLDNAHLPLFVMMTCLNGYFADPGSDALAESLLKAERGGAIAAWASSGILPPTEQAVLNEELYRQLFDRTQALTLGEAVRRAKAAVASPDVRRTWILFGDPAMRLK